MTRSDGLDAAFGVGRGVRGAVFGVGWGLRFLLRGAGCRRRDVDKLAVFGVLNGLKRLWHSEKNAFLLFLPVFCLFFGFFVPRGAVFAACVRLCGASEEKNFRP